MGLNTEYRANLVKARVNVPITLLHIYWDTGSVNVNYF